MNERCCFVFFYSSLITINDLVDIHTQAVQIAGAHIQKHARIEFVKNGQVNENQEMLVSGGDGGTTHKNKKCDEQKGMEPKQQQQWINSLKQRYY